MSVCKVCQSSGFHFLCMHVPPSHCLPAGALGTEALQRRDTWITHSTVQVCACLCSQTCYLHKTSSQYGLHLCSVHLMQPPAIIRRTGPSLSNDKTSGPSLHSLYCSSEVGRSCWSGVGGGGGFLPLELLFWFRCSTTNIHTVTNVHTIHKGSVDK